MLTLLRETGYAAKAQQTFYNGYFGDRILVGVALYTFLRIRRSLKSFILLWVSAVRFQTECGATDKQHTSVLHEVCTVANDSNTEVLSSTCYLEESMKRSN